jgi:hypothetical protein
MVIWRGHGLFALLLAAQETSLMLALFDPYTLVFLPRDKSCCFIW